MRTVQQRAGEDVFPPGQRRGRRSSPRKQTNKTKKREGNRRGRTVPSITGDGVFPPGQGGAEGHHDGSRARAGAYLYEGQVRSSFHLGKGEGEGLHEGSATDARAQLHILQVMESFHLGVGQGLHCGEEKAAESCGRKLRTAPIRV